MKKIITLLFSVGAFATSFAQYNHRQNNDEREGQYSTSSNGNRNYDRDDKEWGHFNKGNNYSVRAKEFQIEKINRDFNYRVMAIQNDRYMRRREKKAAIRNAQNERSRQIQMVNERFRHNNHNH